MEEELDKKPSFRITHPESTGCRTTSSSSDGVQQPLDSGERDGNCQETSSSSGLLMTSHRAAECINLLSSHSTSLRPAAIATQIPFAASASHSVTDSESSTSPPPRSAVVMERENFLVFIKILFKILDQANEPETKSRAQRIVLECRRRSQAGDPNFTPLMDATEKRLRAFVGEAKWRRAHLFLHHYIVNKRGNNQPPSMGVASMRQRPTALIAGK